MRHLLLAVALLASLPAVATPAPPEAAFIAVQDGGRIKPLSTFARYTLLQVSGRTRYTLDDGTRAGALDWLWECLFHPERARERPVFLVESAEVMNALGLPQEERRTRFTYTALAPRKPLLFDLGRRYAAITKEERSPAQEQILRLTHNVHVFEGLTEFVDRSAKPIDLPPSIAAGYGLPASASLSEVLQVTPLILSAKGDDNEARFLRSLSARLQNADLLALVPPRSPKEPSREWLSPAALYERARQGRLPSTGQLDVLQAWELLAKNERSPSQRAGLPGQLNERVRKLAGEERQLQQVPREVRFYRLQPFYWSIVAYGIAFLLVALSWLVPHSRLFYRVTFFATASPLLLHTFGIVQRCIIRGRPPVSTLYETLLFVTAIAVLCALIAEGMNRRRVGVALAAFLGTLGLFLANRYEMIERGDTMPALIAVLDTNFWLSTHVTTITIGYAAGLLAGAIAHVYLVGKALGWRQDDELFYRQLTRMVYGVICFELLFATVGTVLGGIWANDSWGRFWGWDPKENGALMIVLWGLAILHARMGGYIRDLGINLAAVFGAIIVAFSWFGVNLLGVGLHSYGFTTGIHQALQAFYLLEAVVLLIGALAWLRENPIIQVRKTSRTE